MESRLWEALDILRSGGHVKRVYYSPSGCHCVVGAIVRAHTGRDSTDDYCGNMSPALLSDLDRVADVARELFPDRMDGLHWGWQASSIANDHEDGTAADADTMLEKAAIRSDEFLSV